MPRADYEHWNEESDRVWYEEEGRHAPSETDGMSDEDIKQMVYDRMMEDEEYL